MNNKKIGMAAAVVFVGFFVLVLIANAQMTVNQTVTGNFTVSNQTAANSTMSNNNNITATSSAPNQTANSTISNNNNITAAANESGLNQTITNSTFNQTQVTSVASANSTNSTVVVALPAPTVALSAAQALVSMGQAEQLSASVSGGAGALTYYWYEVAPNTNQPVQLTNCYGSSTCSIDTLSGPTGAYSFYVVVGDSEGQAAQSQTAMVLVYP